jgi:hypothetical protein
MYAGISAILRGDKIDIGLSANDDTYSIDYAVKHLDGGTKPKEQRAKIVADWIIEGMQKYQNEHLWCALQNLHTCSGSSLINGP